MTAIRTQAQILETLTSELQQAALLIGIGPAPTDRDVDDLVDLQIAVDQFRGALDDLAQAVAAVPAQPKAGVRLRLDPANIRRHAAEADGSIPPLSDEQVNTVARILVGA